MLHFILLQLLAQLQEVRKKDYFVVVVIKKNIEKRILNNLVHNYMPFWRGCFLECYNIVL